MTSQMVFSILSLALLSGCAVSSGSIVDENGTTTTRYFGYVEVVEATANDSTGINATRTESVGLLVDGGVSIGYVEQERVIIPLGCQIVFLVENQAELDMAISQIDEALKGGEICVAQKP